MTRADLIDPKLRRTGWTIAPFSPELNASAYAACAVTDYPTVNDPAGYTLFVNGRILGFVKDKQDERRAKVDGYLRARGYEMWRL